MKEMYDFLFLQVSSGYGRIYQNAWSKLFFGLDGAGFFNVSPDHIDGRVYLGKIT